MDDKSCERSDDSGELMGAEELGIHILKTIFEVHDMARNEVGFAHFSLVSSFHMLLIKIFLKVS